MITKIKQFFLSTPEELDPKLLLIHRSIFIIGSLFEPLWGLYIKYYTPGGDQSDDLRVRFLMSFILICLSIVTFNKQIYPKHFKWLSLLLIISFNIQRYYLLSLDANSWNSIIDCYTMAILSVLITPTLSILYVTFFILLIPSIFFPEHDYNLLSNLITMIPLVSSFKWSDFKNRIALKKAQEKLKESSIISGAKTFIGTISHDINNSLQKITLLNSLSLHTKDQKAIEKIHNQIEQELSKTAQIIINFKEIINDSPPVESLQSVQSLIEKSVLLYKEKLDVYKINLQVVVANQTIFCDERIFKNIFQPILKNAIDALQEKDISNKVITCSIVQDENNDFLLLKIENNCGSISQEIAQKMFEPFFTTKEKGSGLGLGLSIARDIAHKHNMDILFNESTENSTSFFIRFLKPSEKRNL